MSYLSVLMVALPPGSERAPGELSAGVSTAAVLVDALFWAVLLCWWTRPARRSAQWLAGVCVLVIERSPLVTHLALADQELPGTLPETPASSREEAFRYWSKPPRIEQVERETLRQSGFTPVQIDRLLRCRRAYRAVHDHPDPAAPARLYFARWLYQHGKISG